MNSLGRAASLVCVVSTVGGIWWGLTVAQTPPAKSSVEPQAPTRIEVLSITFRTPDGHVYSGTPATFDQLKAAGLDRECTSGALQCMQAHIFRCALLAGRSYWLNTNETCRSK